MTDALVRPVELAALTRDSIEDTALALARAFRDNPLNRAVIASDDPQRRLTCNRHGMRALLPVALRSGDVRVARRGGRSIGALISTPPGGFPLPPSGIASRLRTLFGQGWRVTQRWAEVFDALAWRHPAEPHWYLGTLGVAPEHQRVGVGGALLRGWLAAVDRDGMPAYLETDREENLAFYGAAGFRVTEQPEVLGVSVWCMWRAAVRRAADA